MSGESTVLEGAEHGSGAGIMKDSSNARMPALKV